MVGAFACPTISVGTSGYAPVAPVAPAGAPQICTTAGPPVLKSLLPSMFAGIGGAVRVCRAAACRVRPPLNVNVALERSIPPDRGLPVPLDGGEAGACT